MTMTAEVLDIPDQEYFAIDAMSNSGIKEFLKSAAHFKAMSTKTFDTRALRIGSCVHQIALGGDNIVVFEDAKSLKGKAYDECKAANPTKRLVLPDEWDLASKIASSLMRKPLWQELVEDSEFEKTLLAKYKDGVVAKAKADVVDFFKGVIVDLKTTSDIDGFERSIYRYRYDIQDAWYTRLFSHVMQVRRFIFVAVETDYPYEVRMFELEDEYRERADQDIDNVLDKYRRCLESDVWPGYDAVIKKVELPGWLRRS